MSNRAAQRPPEVKHRGTVPLFERVEVVPGRMPPSGPYVPPRLIGIGRDGQVWACAAQDSDFGPWCKLDKFEAS